MLLPYAQMHIILLNVNKYMLLPYAQIISNPFASKQNNRRFLLEKVHMTSFIKHSIFWLVNT